MKCPTPILLAASATVVFTAIVLGAVIPWWFHARAAAMENACIDNLRAIDAAKEQWALEVLRAPSSNATPTWGDVALFLGNVPSFCEQGPHGELWGFRLPKYPPCATYTIGRMADSPRCSYRGRTIALCGLLVHVGDASFSGEWLESYNRPGEMQYTLRRAGSIIGATVVVLDETGHRTTAVTGDDGVADFRTLANKPVAVIVSKDGFLTSSNSIRDAYRYDHNILLQRKPR